MPRTIEKTVFKFDELSESAKENARSWWRESDAGDNYWSEYVIEDAVTCASLIGITIDTKQVKLMNGSTRGEPTVYWSGFSSQGDGACFEGRYSYVKGAVKAIRDHAPKDETLHDIAATLQRIQRRSFYRLESIVKHRGHYSHENCTDIDVVSSFDGYDVNESIAEPVRVELRRFMQWIYRQLESAYDYHMSDENVDESIECNEYEFDEDGHIS